MISTLRRSCVELAFALLMSACTTAWHPVPREMLASAETHTYRRVLVVTRDGYERQLVDAVLRPDSLIGTRTDSTRARLALSVSEIVRMESNEHDPAPAVHSVVGLLAGAVAVLAEGIGAIFKCTVFKC
jgi:hypothetical protein